MIPAGGGVATGAPMPEPVTEPRLYPVLLPDGRHYLFLAVKPGQGGYAVHIGSLDSPDSKGTGSIDGQRALCAAGLPRLPSRFVTSRPAARSAHSGIERQSVQIAGDVGMHPMTWQGLFSVSDNGVVVYLNSAPNTELVWFDRQGKRVSALGQPAGYMSLCFSADGKRVISDVADPISGAVDIAMTEIGGSTSTRLTFAPIPDFNPVCARTGEEILFTSLREGRAGLYRQTPTSPGSERAVLLSNIPKLPTDVSRTGEVIYGELRPKTNFDILVLDRSGKESRTYFATEADERAARLSRTSGGWHMSRTKAAPSRSMSNLSRRPVPPSGRCRKAGARSRSGERTGANCIT